VDSLNGFPSAGVHGQRRLEPIALPEKNIMQLMPCPAFPKHENWPLIRTINIPNDTVPIFVNQVQLQAFQSLFKLLKLFTEQILLYRETLSQTLQLIILLQRIPVFPHIRSPAELLVHGLDLILAFFRGLPLRQRFEVIHENPSQSMANFNNLGQLCEN
jgi:hypothetical protein